MPEVIMIGVADTALIPSRDVIARFKTRAIHPPINAVKIAAMIPAMAIFTIHL